ncbi:hypothetical protein HOE04_00475 [archaeon]|jgi:hypothetical protein|nr:hypothetical protein [archaeon]
MKRGQVAIFIILALVVIGATAGIIYVKTSDKTSKQDREFFASLENKPSLNSIQSSIIDCSEETSKQALDTIAIQGGYYTKPENSLELSTSFIPYYYNQGTITQPSKTKIESELSSYINENLKECINQININDFKINQKSPETTTTINKENIQFTIDSPITIEKQDHKIIYELEDSPVTINSELNSIIELAEYITQSHNQDPAMYCISCVADMAEENDLYLDLIPMADQTSLLIISENHTSSEPYSFAFLNKYTGDEKSPDFTAGNQGNIPPKEI